LASRHPPARKADRPPRLWTVNLFKSQKNLSVSKI
jgi:hypothetical protein